MSSQDNNERKLNHRSKFVILYSTLAGFICSWAISGLLIIVDIVSQTPIGTFFAVIGSSLGYQDTSVSQYIGFALHIATGTVAGNIFGQVALFWNKLFPYNLKRGITYGIIVGVSLWIVLFLPLSTFVIQPKLDAFALSAPNQYLFGIADHFQGLYPLVAIGSLGFHIIYGIILGFMVWRMIELKVFVPIKKEPIH
ncbi:MAG: hypothetical protein K0S93_897 [Nitrososphaeraceae archaeon]|jgi:hypothetical protein|nr:hypothetical protein [Nitrososphaeraceae archaeon]